MLFLDLLHPHQLAVIVEEADSLGNLEQTPRVVLISAQCTTAGHPLLAALPRWEILGSQASTRFYFVRLPWLKERPGSSLTFECP